MAPTISCGSPEIITSFDGELTPTDPTWTRPFVNGGTCNPSATGVGVSYETATFQISAAGTYTFSMPSIIGPDFFAALYEGDFDPSQPCNNLLATDDDSNGTEPEITVALTNTTSTYTLVTTTFGVNPNAGPYSYTVTSTGGDVVTTVGEITVDCTTDLSNLPLPIGYDNCDPDPTEQLISENYLDNAICDNDQMVLERTWMAVDHNGMQSEPCTQTIYIQRTNIEFPEDITWTCDQYAAYNNIIDATELNSAITDWDTADNQGDIDVNPNMGNYILSQTGSGIPTGYQGVYCNYNVEHADIVYEHCGAGTFKIVRKWTVIDLCNNTITTSNQIILVDDIEAPTMDFSNPPFQTNSSGAFYLEVSANQADSGQTYCSSTDFIPTPSFADNCSGVDLSTLSILTPVGPVTNLTENGGYIPAPGLGIGTYTDGLTFKIADNCGNIIEQKITLIVIDDIQPTVICDQITKVSLTNNEAGTYYLQITNNNTGCTANDSMKVLLDTFPPEIECPTDTLSFCDDNINSTGCFIDTAQITLFSTDNRYFLGSFSYILNIDSSMDGVLDSTITMGDVGAPNVNVSYNSDGSFLLSIDILNLPYGIHKVTWTITDDCGNSSECTIDIKVEDCVTPQASCDDYIAEIVEVAGNNVAIVDISDVLVDYYDNCTVNDDLVLGITEVPPVNWPPTAMSLTFTCADVGSTVQVLVYVQDAAINSASCTPIITITDPNNLCSESQPLVLGQNMPNPFDQVTNVPFFTAIDQSITLQIYNMQGKVILKDQGDFLAGNNQFIVDKQKSFIGSGVYFYQIHSSTEVSVIKKMVILK